MASGFFLLLDDIATVLDDVSVLTKVAAQKTAGVLGDDLALNAQQVAGVKADRELPVVWAVAKGSFLNKAILVPLSLLISFFAPALIQPLLMLGGAFLCFEGCEKVVHFIFHKDNTSEEKVQHLKNLELTPQQLVEVEKSKIKGAIRTDFILSAEIIVISLGTVAEVSFLQKLLVLSGIAIFMTIGVYGLVAAIVKMDDFGLWCSHSNKPILLQKLGVLIVKAAPVLMKVLSVLGTVAMFLVGGGIVIHGWPWLHHLTEDQNFVLKQLIICLTGIVVGGLILTITHFVKKIKK